ncbi:MAG: EamA family transporter [Elusimicrobiota bacterium]
MRRALGAVLLATICGCAGNLCLREGMIVVGALPGASPTQLFVFYLAAISNPWIWAGILLEIVYSLLWLAVLSWSEISWAVPMNALEYVLAAAAAYALLGEPISPLRLAGIALICTGVALLSGSWIEAGPTTE